MKSDAELTRSCPAIVSVLRVYLRTMLPKVTGRLDGVREGMYYRMETFAFVTENQQKPSTTFT